MLQNFIKVKSQLYQILSKFCTQEKIGLVMQEIYVSTSQTNKLFKEMISKSQLNQDQTSQFQIHPKKFKKITEQIAKGQAQRFKTKLENLGKDFINISREYKKEQQRVQALQMDLGKDESGMVKILKLLFLQDYAEAFAQIEKDQTINKARFRQLIQKCYLADFIENYMFKSNSDYICPTQLSPKNQKAQSKSKHQ